jgi:hypothetical protein
MPYQSNLPQIARQMKAARSAGLIAAADLYVERMKVALQGGFTSGRYVTGETVGSVERGEPVRDDRGEHILAGTDHYIARFWELGHDNIITKRYERVEIWWPTFVETRQEQIAAFEKAYRAVMTTQPPAAQRVA